VTDASIGKNNIEVTELLFDSSKQDVASFRIQHIGVEGERIWAKLSRGSVKRRLIASGDGDRAPSATNSRAVAKPMPLLPPVINAVLFLSFIFGMVNEHQFCRIELAFLCRFPRTARFAKARKVKYQRQRSLRE